MRFMDGGLFGGALGLFYFTVVILVEVQICPSLAGRGLLRSHHEFLKGEIL